MAIRTAWRAGVAKGDGAAKVGGDANDANDDSASCRQQQQRARKHTVAQP
jgi:hypothetical protein